MNAPRCCPHGAASCPIFGSGPRRGGVYSVVCEKTSPGRPGLILLLASPAGERVGRGPGRADVNRLSHAACLALAPASTTPSATPKLPSRARQALDRLGARGGGGAERMDEGRSGRSAPLSRFTTIRQATDTVARRRPAHVATRRGRGADGPANSRPRDHRQRFGSMGLAGVPWPDVEEYRRCERSSAHVRIRPRWTASGSGQRRALQSSEPC